VKVAISAPVSALTTVKLVTVWAATHAGVHIVAAKKIAADAFESFIR
jgi:hypothetical protein